MLNVGIRQYLPFDTSPRNGRNVSNLVIPGGLRAIAEPMNECPELGSARTMLNVRVWVLPVANRTGG